MTFAPSALHFRSVNGAIRVYVVDDTEHVRRMLTTMLSVDGFEVVGGASDGATALAQIAAHDPDVVVVDYKMPSLDGLATARQIKAIRPDQHVIIYSAFVEPDLEEQAAEIGVAVCVGKVEGISSLEQEIRRLVRP